MRSKIWRTEAGEARSLRMRSNRAEWGKAGTDLRSWNANRGWDKEPGWGEEATLSLGFFPCTCLLLLCVCSILGDRWK